MNYGAYNSYGCNSQPLSGDNTILDGGLSSSVSSIVSALIVGAMLAGGPASAQSVYEATAYSYSFPGGVASDTNAYGRVALVVSGGVHTASTEIGADIGIRQGGGVWSDSFVDSNVWRFSVRGGLHGTSEIDGKWFLPITLYSGITSLAETGGVLDWKAGLYGGIESNAHQDQTYIISSMLNSGLVSIHSHGGVLQCSPLLSGGIQTEDALSASVMGGATLLGSLSSSSKVDSPDMKSGRNLYYGVESLSGVEATAQVWAVLNPTETPSLDSLGGQVRTDIRFQGGMVSVGEPYANMILAAELDDGFGSSARLGSELQASPRIQGGSDSTSGVGASYRLWASLAGGADSVSVVESSALRSSILLRDGIDVTGFVDAMHALDAIRHGGMSQSQRIESALGLHIKLNYGVESVSTNNAAYRLSPTAVGGMDSTSLISSSIKGNQILPSGVGSAATLWTQLVVSQTLGGGIMDSYSLADAEISSYYGDMLHNTGALEVSSATLPLNIETPKGDT